MGVIGINVPTEKLGALGKPKDLTWRPTPKDKGDGLIGAVEVMHQLHCLVSNRPFFFLSFQ